MLKTRKLISLVLVVAMILSMGIVGMVSAAADDDTYYLVGTITDWQAADYVFTANEAAEGEYYLNGVALSSGDELKVNNGGDSWFPSGMNNNYVVAEDGTYNVYFRPDGQGGSDWHEGFFYLEIAGESVDPTEAPADPTEAPADPTEAPADPTEAPADPTEAPADPTEAPADPTEAPAEPGTGAEIKIDGVTYNAHVGDTIHYEFFLDMSGVKGDGTHPGKATEIDASLYYDHSKLKLLTSIEDDEETRINPFVPNLSKITSNDTGSKVTYNGTNGNTATGEDAYTKGYNFTEKRVLVHADFEVIAGGSSEIVHIFENLGSGDVKVIYLQTANPDYPIATETVVSVDCPHTTEPTTAEPTTAEPTTASDKAIITVKDHIAGTEETRTYSIGDKFVVIATLNVPDGYRVNSIDVWQEFNIGDATLKVLTDVDDDDDVFPQIGDPTPNVAGNIIKVNATKAKYKQSYKFSTADTGEEAATLMRIEYEVIAAGKTTIETQIKTMALIVDGDDMQDAVKGGEKLDGAPEFKTTTVFDGEAPVEPTTAEPTTAEPTTAEPTTAEPTTAEPTTAEPTTAEPTTAEPTTAEPTTAEPTTAEPTTAEPTTAEPTSDVPDLAIYYFEQESYDYYKADGGDLVMVVHNDKDDTKTFGNFDKLLINDQVATNVVFAEGSLIITVPADEIDTNFNLGTNRVAAMFSDEDGSYVAAADVNIYDGNAPTEAPEETVAPTSAPATNGKSTSDSSSTTTNTSTVKTGSTEMAIIFLMILVMAAGVVIFTKKRKID